MIGLTLLAGLAFAADLRVVLSADAPADRLTEQRMLDELAQTTSAVVTEVEPPDGWGEMDLPARIHWSRGALDGADVMIWLEPGEVSAAAIVLRAEEPAIALDAPSGDLGIAELALSIEELIDAPLPSSATEAGTIQLGFDGRTFLGDQGRDGPDPRLAWSAVGVARRDRIWLGLELSKQAGWDDGLQDGGYGIGLVAGQPLLDVGFELGPVLAVSRTSQRVLMERSDGAYNVVGFAQVRVGVGLYGEIPLSDGVSLRFDGRGELLPWRDHIEVVDGGTVYDTGRFDTTLAAGLRFRP